MEGIYVNGVDLIRRIENKESYGLTTPLLTNANGEKMGKTVPERKSSFYQSRRVPYNQASHTLSEQGLMTSLAVHLHPEEDRVFTTKESARIMTLPDDYIFTGTLNQNLARIGLMVAPLCLKYLADNIYENILKPYKEL